MNKQIEQLSSEFVTKIAAAVRANVIEQLQTALAEPKRRGRPPKTATKKTVAKTSSKTGKRRGRPRKAKPAELPVQTDTPDTLRNPWP